MDSLNNKVSIKNIILKGIHGKYDLELDFNDKLNILHGKNGTGKSTLLHIIANIANCDFMRFAFIKFEEIHIEYSNGYIISLTRSEKKGDELICIEVIEKQTNLKNKINLYKEELIREILTEKQDDLDEEYEAKNKKNILKFSEKNQLNTIKVSYFA